VAIPNVSTPLERDTSASSSIASPQPTSTATTSSSTPQEQRSLSIDSSSGPHEETTCDDEGSTVTEEEFLLYGSVWARFFLFDEKNPGRYLCKVCGASVAARQKIKGIKVANLKAHLCGGKNLHSLEKNLHTQLFQLGCSRETGDVSDAHVRITLESIEQELAAAKSKRKSSQLLLRFDQSANSLSAQEKAPASPALAFNLLCVACCLPFRLSDHPFLKLFVKALSPISNVRQIERHAQGGAVLDWVYRFFVAKELVKFRQAPGFSISFDGWTSPSNKSVIALLFHYLDDSFQPCTSVLRVAVLEQRHSAAELARFIAQSIQKFSTDSQIMYCSVTDNASNVIKAARFLQNSLTVSNDTWDDMEVDESDETKSRAFGCLAHTLELAVKNFLEDINLITLLDLVRQFVKGVKASPQRQSAFRKVQHVLNGRALNLILDCPTRWGSTFLMLERFLDLYDELMIGVTYEECLKDISSRVFGSSEITKLNTLRKVLQPVYLVTKSIQWEYRFSLPHLPAIVRFLFLTVTTIKDISDDSERFFRTQLSHRLYERLSSYCNSASSPALLAAIVHPAYSLHISKLIIVKEFSVTDDPTHNTSTSALDLAKKKEIFVGVVSQIKEWYCILNFSPPRESPIDEGENFLSTVTLAPSDANQGNELAFTNALASLKSVSKPLFEFEQGDHATWTDPIEFFRRLKQLEAEDWIGKVYVGTKMEPTPAPLVPFRSTARLLLSAPASSADAERTFTSAGLVLGDLRSRLNDETFEKLVITRHCLLHALRDVDDKWERLEPFLLSLSRGLSADEINIM